MDNPEPSLIEMMRKDTKLHGVGKGGHPHRGKAHPLYKHGRYTYETRRKEIKIERRYCNRCQKDLQEATRYQWVIHHVDHDKFNNDESNLELLCKRCHQLEHNCHLAFKGATTIPEKEVGSSDPKRPASRRDDDIV